MGGGGVGKRGMALAERLPMSLFVAKSSFLALVAFAASAAFITGCATDTIDQPDDQATLADEESDLTSSAPFICDGKADQAHEPGKSGLVVAARAAAHPEGGYDRFVLQFQAGTQPKQYYVASEGSTSFPGTGEGTPLRVKGEGGIRVVFQGSMMEGNGYAGAKRFSVANGTGIKEAAMIEEFESNAEWALGTKKSPCFRTTTLLNPPRLVVDVKR